MRRVSSPAGQVGACLLVACVVLTVAAGPVTTVASTTARAQETTGGTATAANATGDGSQLETAASDAEGGGGIVASVLGLVGGVVWAILGVLDSSIGHALVGIPLGIYLGLKAIALYLEHYE